MQKLSHTLVLLVSALLAFSTAARAQAPALPDSVTEQKIVRTVGADMCRQLEQENTKKPLTELTGADAQALFVRLIMASATTSPELIAVFTSSPEAARSYGERVGKQIGFWLFRECPVSQPMFMKMGMQELNKQQPLTAAETKILQPMSVEVCRDLQARQQKQNLKTLSADKRDVLLQEVLQASMKTHAKELTQQYGADIFLDEARMKQVGIKLGLQMGSQCPTLLMLFADLKGQK